MTMLIDRADQLGLTTEEYIKMSKPMSKYMWIIESTIEAWIAGETYMVLPNTVFVSEANSGSIKESRGAFLRYVDGVLTIDNGPVDVGDYLPQFLGIMDAVKENNGRVTVLQQGE